MIVVKLYGGLGNQMFQYACAKALALASGNGLLLDVHHFDRPPANETPRQYQLHFFPAIQERFATADDIRRIVPVFGNQLLTRLYALVNQRLLHFNPAYLIEQDFPFPKQLKKPVYMDGYWQSERYFEAAAAVIRNQFCLAHLQPIPEVATMLQQMQAATPVSLHVRRGDYLQHPSHGIMQMEYYKSAFSRIAAAVEQPHLFIFSDDIEWCRKNIQLSTRQTFVNTGQDHYDLYLMSCCKHNIIANSTFSWWAAWLNAHPQKIVVAPHKWFAAREAANLIPAGWQTA